MHPATTTAAAALAGIALLLASPGRPPWATEIYKCKDEHGNVAYREMPCEDESARPAGAPDNPEPLQVERKRTAEEIDACKQPLRDAIDVIEAEMLRGYPAGRSDEFKARLIELTQQMRACE